MSSDALKAAATAGAVGTPRKTLFDMLQNPKFAKGLGAVASKYLTPERMLSLCINAVKKTPLLMECDPQSVMGAMMASASLGLEPNTPQQQAFLIPYKRRVKQGNEWVSVYDCQFQIGARGFVTLAYRSPEIKFMTAEAIHEGDLWENEVGSKSFLRYSKTLNDRGGLRGAFSYVRFTGGDEGACVLPLDEILKIRSKSETYRSLVDRVTKAENAKDRATAERNLAETPWSMWEDDMASKSAIKKHAKQLPLTGTALALAADLDSAGDQGIVDMTAFSDPDHVRAVVADEAEIPQRQAIEHQPSETLQFPAETRQTENMVPAEERQPRKPARKGADQVDNGPTKRSYAVWADLLAKAPNEDAAALLLDQARADLPEDQQSDLAKLFTRTWRNA